MRTNLTPSDIERFWSYVDTSGGTDSCWPWTGFKGQDGYGFLTISRNGKWWPERAHRISWYIANGPIPADRNIILHACDNPKCCNPAHLSNGTIAENNLDCCRKGRNAGGSPPGERAAKAKLTSSDVVRIRKMYAAGGISMQGLADMFGVRNQSIFAIIHRKSWKHIP